MNRDTRLLPVLLVAAAVAVLLGSCVLHKPLPSWHAQEDGESPGLAPVEELWILVRPESVPDDLASDTAAPGLGRLQVVADDTDAPIPMPLQHTGVQARIDGYLATVEVRQAFHNPYDDVVDAEYVFPLPHNSAVSEFVMTVGERRIRGLIREREEAEQIYEEARQQGYVASLLTQERPNLFTQRVANLEPGRDIDVELVYHQALAYRDEAWSFVFPMVVGPRFNPPDATDGVGSVSRDAPGRSGQPTEIAYLAPGERTAHDISLSIELDAGLPIHDLASPTHETDARRTGRGRWTVKLAPTDSLPNRDFVLRYAVATDDISTAFLTHTVGDQTWFTAVLHPPEELVEIPTAPLELVMVLDCSGSMAGAPMRYSKRAIHQMLDSLGPEDSFQIIKFSMRSSKLGDEPVPATGENLDQARAYVDRMRGSGGTMMVEGIRAALEFPHDPHRVRVVAFLTDGYIGNEQEILRVLAENLGSTKVFSFGVGSAPNRFLMERMASFGQGAVAYISRDTDDSDGAVATFLDRIRHPALADIDIDWGRSEVHEVYPSRIPDLWSGRPTIVTGRIDGPLADRFEVGGWVGGEHRILEVPTRLDGVPRPGLPKVWARMKIRDLADGSMLVDDPRSHNAEILDLALRYGLMSRFTAFVAVDSSRPVDAPSEGIVPQAIVVPEGVSYDMAVGE